MKSDDLADPPAFDSMEVELSVEEAAVVGAMRRDERTREAVLNYAISFNG